MNPLSGVICDKNSRIEYVITDEHELFSALEVKSLFDLVDEGSEEKLSSFLQTLKDEKSSLNWEINLHKKRQIKTMFFSGLFWMNKYFITISSEKSTMFFYPFNHQTYDAEDLFGVGDEGDLSTEKLNEISRLNNELVDIQRELTKKNRQLEDLNERLEKLATTDPLTGIFNRRAILSRAETELERAARGGRFFSLAILDLDDFKQINDSYGHQLGDEALKRLAECLKETTRNYDSAGRFGGDEFLVFFGLTDSEQFVAVLERLLKQINETTISVNETSTFHLMASIGGVIVKPGDASEMDIETLIGYADKMLYQAKNNEETAIVVSAFDGKLSD